MKSNSASRRSQEIMAQRQILMDALAPHLSWGEDYALIGFPFHTNVGDSAIWLGERSLLLELSGRDPAYVCQAREFDFEEAKLNRACPEGPIFLQGGGHFGDLWPSFHMLRERLLMTLKGRRLIQLPVSIHFTDATKAQACARIIATHKDFTLMVRDPASLKWGIENLDCPTTLVPDCAVALGPLTSNSIPSGTLLLLRQDKEQLSTDTGCLMELRGTRQCDWVDSSRVGRRLWRAAIASAALFGQRALLATLDAHARSQLARGVGLVSSAKEIVTDRLHGHLVGWMTERPQVVLNNGDGKVHEYVKRWTEKSSGVVLAASPGEAARLVADFLDEPSGTQR